MTLLNTHFYHGTIKLYTAVIGSMFNDIKIKRDSGFIKVPIIYANQQKQNNRIDADNNGTDDNPRYKMRLPAFSFVLTGWEKDPTRQLNKSHTLHNSVKSTGIRTQLNRVAYNFNYTVHARTKHLDDMLQIVEQVLPAFNPHLLVVVEDIPNLNRETELKVTLNSSNVEDQVNGLYEDGRELVVTFDLTLQGYLYMPTQESGLIEKVRINFRDLHDPDVILDSIEEP